jgi:hypothetical protein
MFICFLWVALIVPRAMIVQLAPALTLDGSNASIGKSVPLTSFTIGQEALRVGEEDVGARKMEASVSALTYAA